MKEVKKKFKSNAIILLCIIVVTWVNLNQEQYLKGDVIVHDVAKYYSYLPAFFYEKDLSLSFLTNENDSVWTHYSPNKTKDGHLIIKMSMGLALCYLPFFGLGHLFATILNYPTDGYSPPYQFAIQFSTLFYYILGLLALRKALRKFFTEPVVLIVLFLLTFSTNILYYLTIGSGYSHIYSFTFSAFLINLSFQWKESPGVANAIKLGVVCSLLCLIRPINILFPVFWLIYNSNLSASIAANITDWIRNWRKLLIVAFCVCAVIALQIFYWHYVTGKFIVNSYVDEGFFFLNPKIVKGLFSFRKGWFVYTPLMLLSVIGFGTLWRSSRQLFWAIGPLILLYLYVVFSWWCWWYGGSFGQRALIDIYCFMAFPLAACLKAGLDYSKFTKVLLIFLCTFLLLLNVLQTIQAKYNILHYDSMTRKNYFEIFGTITTKTDREKYLDHPNYEKARRGEEE